MQSDNLTTRRKTLAILRILQENGDPMGASRIAREMAEQGFLQSERMVRVYLHELDKQGLTQNLGRAGRAITPLGRQELQSGAALDKVGFVLARADALAYQMTLDLEKRQGTLVVNLSLLPKSALRTAIRYIEAAFEAKMGVGRLLAFADEGQTFAGQSVPEKHVMIATVCSLTMNGIFLDAGIPTTSVFGGLLEIQDGKPSRFSQIIRYDGTTLDPLEIFIQGNMTSVETAARLGRGWIGAGFREIPSAARNHALELKAALEEAGLGCILMVGDANQPLLDFPVPHGRTGVILSAGLNPIAAAHERGVKTESTAMSVLMDIRQMDHYLNMRSLMVPEIHAEPARTAPARN